MDTQQGAATDGLFVPPHRRMSHPDGGLPFCASSWGSYFASHRHQAGHRDGGRGAALPGRLERWINTMPKIVAKQAADNPILFYKHFLENTVLTHPQTLPT